MELEALRKRALEAAKASTTTTYHVHGPGNLMHLIGNQGGASMGQGAFGGASIGAPITTGSGVVGATGTASSRDIPAVCSEETAATAAIVAELEEQLARLKQQAETADETMLQVLEEEENYKAKITSLLTAIASLEAQNAMLEGDEERTQLHQEQAENNKRVVEDLQVKLAALEEVNKLAVEDLEASKAKIASLEADKSQRIQDCMEYQQKIKAQDARDQELQEAIELLEQDLGQARDQLSAVQAKTTACLSPVLQVPSNGSADEEKEIVTPERDLVPALKDANEKIEEQDRKLHEAYFKLEEASNQIKTLQATLKVEVRKLDTANIKCQNLSNANKVLGKANDAQAQEITTLRAAMTAPQVQNVEKDKENVLDQSVQSEDSASSAATFKSLSPAFPGQARASTGRYGALASMSGHHPSDRETSYHKGSHDMK
jgi:DNA repair exonuclease SbcCD ATPase subunit